ncbi:hypothetical protein EUGRSUZ_G01090 [Eucalyptus grandis]|uniref:Uncharacterized protein n=2 Tax=Eucalyptus grandis TaxID=71139 RepID=A0ACC3K221_EUCGR|nr:hypothetical protein EUGRSUZ_G01090 [Eucalyptus grandis]
MFVGEEDNPGHEVAKAVKIRDILDIEAIKICKEDFWPWPFIISYLIFLCLRRNCNLVGQFKCSRILFDGT